MQYEQIRYEQRGAVAVVTLKRPDQRNTVTYQGLDEPLVAVARVVGISRAVEWAMTGRIFDASEALAAGLVRELVPAAQVLDRAMQIADEIASSASAVSVALTRRMMWQQLGVDHPMHANVVESR